MEFIDQLLLGVRHGAMCWEFKNTMPFSSRSSPSPEGDTLINRYTHHPSLTTEQNKPEDTFT